MPCAVCRLCLQSHNSAGRRRCRHDGTEGGSKNYFVEVAVRLSSGFRLQNAFTAVLLYTYDIPRYDDTKLKLYLYTTHDIAHSNKEYYRRNKEIVETHSVVRPLHFLF